jgi:putative ABC transport system permease protein
MLWVSDELSYDKYQENYDSIYRLGIDAKIKTMEGCYSNSCSPLGPVLKDELPEISDFVRIQKITEALISNKDTNQSFLEKHFFYADSSLFNVFSIPILKKNTPNPLSKPKTAVITTSFAKKYFGDSEPVGKTITINNRNNYEVVAVVADPPENSHLQYSIFVSFQAMAKHYQNMWLSDNLVTYVLISNKIEQTRLEQKINSIFREHSNKIFQQATGSSFDEWLAGDQKYQYFIEPLKDIYLHSKAGNRLGESSDIIYVYALLIVALFILLIACINFTNLTSARASLRTKEVGMRKILGSSKNLIIRQMLSETIIQSTIALIFALALTELALPYFNNIASKELSLPWNQWHFYPLIAVLTLVVGFICGIYSAISISSFKVSSVLKPGVTKNSKQLWFRNSLVLVQFTISIVIMICTFLVYQQLNYINSKDLGFDKQHVLVIDRFNYLEDQQAAFKSEINKLTGVSSASVCSNAPGMGRSNGMVLNIEGSPPDDMFHFGQIAVDEDFAETFKIDLNYGSFFQPNQPNNYCIINQTALDNLNLEQPIGKKLASPGEKGGLTILGVIEDYHIFSLREKIPNVILVTKANYYKQNLNYLAIKINGDLSSTFQSIKKLWQEFKPNEPLQYFFIDSKFDDLHKAQHRTSHIFTIFSIVAILLACLGLLGLAAFTAQQKTKEIGIRKVLGASVSNIILLLSKQFLRWVILANVIAWPLAWYVTSKWLENFAYHVKLSLHIFFLAGFLTLLIAMLTIIFQTYRAANQNPIKSIKYE